MKRRVAAAAGLVAAATLASAALPARPLFVWNISASAPTGLYRIESDSGFSLGDRVAIDPPPDLAALLAERGYLPHGVPLIKQIAATGGDRVCRDAGTVTVNGKSAAHAKARDRRGRSLPAWQGCRLLETDELFFINTGVPDSFDSRYFGPLRRDRVIGRARPIWTDETLAPAPGHRATAALPDHQDRNQGEDL